MQTLNNWPINGANPVVVSGTGITAKYFPFPTSNFTAGAGSTPNANNAAGQLLVPGSNKLNGQTFRVYAAGSILTSGTPSPSILIELVANTGSVSTPSYTVLGSSGTDTPAINDGVYLPWSIVAEASGDSDSGILQGSYRFMLDNTVENSTPKAFDNTLTGLVFGPSATTSQDARHAESGANAVFGLVVRVTFGTSAAANTAKMYEFRLES